MKTEGLTTKITAIAEVLLCSSVPTQVLIASGLGMAGWRPLDDAGHLSLSFVVTLSVLDTVVLIGLMTGLTIAHGERVSELWLGSRPVRREIAVGLLLIPVVFSLVVALLSFLRAVAPELHNVPDNPLERMTGTATGAALLGVVAILAGGVREELQRAFLLRRFERYLGGAAVGVIALSIGFGLGHSVQGWDAVIATGVLGAFWAVLYLIRQSVVAPLVSHAGFNTLEVLRAALTGQ